MPGAQVVLAAPRALAEAAVSVAAAALGAAPQGPGEAAAPGATSDS